MCDQCTYGYELRRGTARKWPVTQYVGWFHALDEARQAAVPGHPEEWVWLDEDGVWFHGGGNSPGEWFVILPGVA